MSGGRGRPGMMKAMAARFEHPSYFGRVSAAAAADQAEMAAGAAERRRAEAGRACCCTAMPAVIAMIPAGTGRPAPTDLLLCVHHYRKLRTALIAAGASLLDLDGNPLPPVPWPREPGSAER